MELKDETSSKVTPMLLEATMDEIVVLASAKVLGVGETVLMMLVAVTTSVGVTKVVGGTDERGELVSVMVIGVDASVSGVLVGVTAPSEEIGSVGVGVIVVA